jgi:coproporphyrinogen III oxidase
MNRGFLINLTPPMISPKLSFGKYIHQKPTVMSTLIDSAELIRQLKKNDILFLPEKKESYLIDEVCEGYFILKQADELRVLKSVFFFELIKDKWELQFATNE